MEESNVMGSVTVVESIMCLKCSRKQLNVVAESNHKRGWGMAL